MIRRLMASTAMLALLATGGITASQAQTTPAETPAATVETGAATTDMAPAAGAEATLTPDQPTIASAFMGRTVYSSQDQQSENIGEVNDLIIGDDGMITHAVVGVGGFLGIGEKDVAVPFDELQVVEEDNGDIRLIYAATREQLESAEAFDRTAYDPRARANEQQAAAADNAAAGNNAAPAGGDMAAAPAAGMTAAPADTATPALGDTTAGTNMAAAPAAGTTAAPADATTPALSDPNAGTNMAATEAPADATQSQPAGAMSAEGRFIAFNADQVRASSLLGKQIYGPDDSGIGEISDLVLEADGSTRSALVDVGGFLGIGEKRVAIPFEQLNVGVQEGSDEARVAVDMTREQLEQAPAYVSPEDTAAAAAAESAVADQNAAPATDTAMNAGQPATTPGSAVTPGTAPADGTAPAGDANLAAGNADMVAGNADMAADARQYTPVTQDMTAENLIGSAVYGSNDENLGEVNDVVFDPKGAIQAVVVDVGGFLGVGEKPVAVQYDALNVEKNTEGDIRLMMNTTQEQLQNAPSYETTTGQATVQ